MTLEATVFPQHGYPFLVRHRVQYFLAEDLGLVVRQTLINDSEPPAPFVLGAHPYLRLGDAPMRGPRPDRDAETRLVADERLIPRSSEPVGGDTDFRAGRKVGDLGVDVALTDLKFDGGIARHTLSRAGRPQRQPVAGRNVRVRPRVCDPEFPGRPGRWPSNP